MAFRFPLQDWVHSTSTPALGAWLFAAMLVAALLGGFVKRRLAATGEEGWAGNEAQEGYALSAVLGLLALLVGFSYALAVDRYEERRQLVVEEANAVAVAFLHTRLLSEPHRERGLRILSAYLDNRIELGRAMSHDVARPLLRRDEQLVSELWRAAEAAYPTIRDYDFSTAYLAAVSRVVEVDVARKEARSVHVPFAAVALLTIYLIVAAGMLGFVMKGTGGRMVSAFLLVLLTLSILLVIDIDRPVRGAVNESQAPLLSLRGTLAALP